MKTMTRQKTCTIPGCHRLPAAKGKCTHHLGLITNGQITSRHLRMKEETMAPRQFEFFDESPRSVNRRQELTAELREFAEALQANAGRWAQLPPDLINPRWDSLTGEEKASEVARLTRAITKGAAWRMPGGHFRASRVNGSVWATWVEYDGVRP